MSLDCGLFEPLSSSFSLQTCTSRLLPKNSQSRNLTPMSGRYPVAATYGSDTWSLKMVVQKFKKDQTSLFMCSFFLAAVVWESKANAILGSRLCKCHGSPHASLPWLRLVLRLGSVKHTHNIPKLKAITSAQIQEIPQLSLGKLGPRWANYPWRSK